jgi:hypothetical protein
MLATKATPGLARTLAETRLYKWGFMDKSGDVLLVVTELVANAIEETPNCEIKIRTCQQHWDDNGGWGLALVQALSADCGCNPDPAGGKWVWARLKP